MAPTKIKFGPASQLVPPASTVAGCVVVVSSLFSEGAALKLPKILLKFLGLFVIVILLKSSSSLWAAYKSWSLGCAPPPSFPHKDPILGLDFFKAAIRNLRAGTILIYFNELFQSIAPTFWHLTLGSPMIMTIQPENMKTILQTKFEEWPIMGPRKEALKALLGDTNIFQANGQAWKHSRAMIRPTFVRDQIADLKCFDRHVNNLIKLIHQNETVDLQRLFFQLTMDSSSDFM